MKKKKYNKEKKNKHVKHAFELIEIDFLNSTEILILIQYIFYDKMYSII